MSTASCNYAKVLYQLSVQSESIENAENTLKVCPELFKALCSPVLQAENKYRIIDKVFPEDIRNFIKVICKNGRMSQIFDIFSEYRNWYNFENEILEAKLYYVAEPTAQQQERLKRFLMKKFGVKEVKLILTAKPELIGGFIIEAGGREFDRSIKSKLDALNRKLVWR